MKDRMAGRVRAFIAAAALAAAMMVGAVGGPGSLAAQTPAGRAALGVGRPVGGDRCAAGSAQTIRWSAAGIAGAVRIMLWNGETGAWLPIAGGIPAARGEYTWHVPPGLCGRMFRIKVQSEEGGAYAMTGSYFFIEPPERSASAARRLPGDAMWLR